MSWIFDLGITFTANSEDNLVGYTNFDYARLIDDEKSIGDYIFMLSSRPLFHQSKLQSTVALLLTKTEYIAITKAKKKHCGLHNFWLVSDFAYLVNLSTYAQIIKGQCC